MQSNSIEDVSLVYLILIPKDIKELPYLGNINPAFEACFLASNYKNLFMRNIGDVLNTRADSKIIKFLKFHTPKLLFEKTIQEYRLKETHNYIIDIGVSKYNLDTLYWQEIVNEFDKLYETSKKQEKKKKKKKRKKKK